MGEGHLQKFVRSVQSRLIIWVAIIGLVFALAQWILQELIGLNLIITSVILAVFWFGGAVIVGMKLGRSLTKPTEYIAQAIQHISPNEHLVPAPKIDELKFGHDLADSLTRQVYNFATITQDNTPTKESMPTALLDQLPIAVIGISETNSITLANTKALTITKMPNLAGLALQDTLKFLTENEESIESWLQTTREKTLTDIKTWQKVEVKANDGTSLGYFDVAVSFHKHSSSGTEAIFAFYDHSEVYAEEMNSLSFVSLAVHELRTPVTVMRGYIEAFKDELGENSTPQLNDDLRKMNVSAESLSSFVSNILNVARINQGQLSLKLEKDNWNTLLPKIVDGLRNRAAVYGKEIELRMQPNMPEVGVDRMTVGEVITNLLDNAIKYTPNNNDKIQIISRINKDGVVETTVIDHGVGIPSSVVPNLFSKFYRNHRTSTQIGGTGLGLYLCKAVVNAHHGNIWVQSKEGEGSTFGFTLLPYDQLAKDQQTNNNESIVRSSHGWIKNHSMQRQ